ncbi:MAG: TldD/PmbA family protein [Candidatus Heimdallarchaeota archaeon]
MSETDRFSELMNPQNYPDLELNDPSAKNLSASNVTDKIVASIQAAHDVSSKVQSVSGNTNLRDGFDYYLSSEGHEVITPVTRITSSVNVMANDGQGESRSNSSFGERRFAKLPLEEESTNVAERAVLGLNPQDIEPGTYKVVLDHQAAGRQMFLLGIALSAKGVVDQRSFLKDKIGEKVFSDSMTFLNSPHNPELLSARALDWEGVASKSYALIRNGILENYAHDRLSAKQMGVKTNGCCLISEYGSFPFPFACALDAGQKNRQRLIEEMDNGLLVTNLHYTNFIDPSRGTETGTTKDGLFIIKNGEIVGAARNLRFTDSMPEMLKTVEFSSEVSQIIGFFGFPISVPAMQLEAMKFSSQA